MEWVPKAWLVSWFKQDIRFPIAKVEPAAVTLDGALASRDLACQRDLACKQQACLQAVLTVVRNTDDIVEVEDDLERAKRLSSNEQDEASKETADLEAAMANSLNGIELLEGDSKPAQDVITLEDTSSAADAIIVTGMSLEPLVARATSCYF